MSSNSRITISFASLLPGRPPALKDLPAKDEDEDFETPTMSFESFLTYDAPTAIKKKKKPSSSSHSRPSHSSSAAAVSSSHHTRTPQSATTSSSKGSKANGQSTKRSYSGSSSAAAAPEKRKRVRREEDIPRQMMRSFLLKEPSVGSGTSQGPVPLTNFSLPLFII